MLEYAKTKYGLMKSVVSNGGHALFRGVPYAKAPVGERRFKAPEEAECFEGTRICDSFGPACMQYDRWSNATDDITDDDSHPYIHIKNYPYPPKMSEDCLYLNIYTPAESDEERLPVMLYIHGGGCQQWYGSDYEYCGDRFCDHGVILVSISYRLNVFGFFTHPDLAKESGQDASGNYGLLDQIMALRFVYENISAFGGDPDNITVFGQSSGGRSTMALLCSPLTKGMIRRVSIQSAGGLGRFVGDRTRKESEELGVKFMTDLGCRSIDEMRDLDAEVLRDANDRLGFADGFNIHTDGYVLKEEIRDCFKNGHVPKDVDIIIGCTADEGANEKTPVFGINMYEEIRDLCKVYSKIYDRNIYMYVFDQKQPGDDAGVPHSCDNRYQFGTLDGSWRPYSKKDYELSEKMLEYWSSFARTGIPKAGDEVWEGFKEKEKALWLSEQGCRMR